MFDTCNTTICPVYPQAIKKENVLLLGTSQGLKLIDIDSILRVEAISNYCKIIFTNGKSLVVAKLLSWFEEKLVSKRFTRLHRSHLVNMQYIRSYTYFDTAEVELTNNERLTVSRRKRIEFKKAIQQYYNNKVAA